MSGGLEDHSNSEKKHVGTNNGTLYGIGVGPGDADLITVKGAETIAACPHVFVPKARMKAKSVALTIAGKYISPQAQVHELVFPMTMDKSELHSRWEEAAEVVASVLETGENACFLTLGDSFLYSTYTYLIRALRRRLPNVEVVTIPGITAFSAAAALAEFPIGVAKETVTIVPTADDLAEVNRAVSGAGTVVLMKIGKRLSTILDLLKDLGAMERSVFVSHVGMESQRIETDLNKLSDSDSEAGYLSIILVRGNTEEG
ncbi:precorrin-2 C(20)-methyltransferase [Thermodesulfobacteriota bacterium]